MPHPSVDDASFGTLAGQVLFGVATVVPGVRGESDVRLWPNTMVELVCYVPKPYRAKRPVCTLATSPFLQAKENCFKGMSDLERVPTDGLDLKSISADFRES